MKSCQRILQLEKQEKLKQEKLKDGPVSFLSATKCYTETRGLMLGQNFGKPRKPNPEIIKKPKGHPN